MTYNYEVRPYNSAWSVTHKTTGALVEVFSEWADAYEYASRLNMFGAAIVDQLRERND